MALFWDCRLVPTTPALTVMIGGAVLLAALLPAACNSEFYKSSFSVPEDAAVGTVVGSVMPWTPNAKLFNGAGQGAVPFVLDANGNLLTAETLNRILHARYQLIILLNNGNIHQVDIEVLDVNNHAPVFAVSVINVTIAESAAVGSQIMQLQSAVDPDFGSNSTQGYRIVAGNTGGAFTVEVLSAGTASVFAVLRVNRSLSYAQQPAYQLVVQAYDGRGRTGNLTLNIRVSNTNDALPRFDHSTYTAMLLDNVTGNDAVLRVRAVDPELGNFSTIIYSINAAASNASQLFFIDSSQGALYIVQKLTVPIGQASATYVLQIDATIGDASLGRTSSCSVLVTVISIAQSMPQINTVILLPEVPEDISLTEPVMLVSTSDPSGNTIVNITRGNEDSLFELRRLAGSQYQVFATPALASSLRRGLFNLTLSVMSAAWPYLKSATSAVFSVYDINKNAPAFGAASYSVFFPEGSPRGTVLTLNATARDSDRGNNGLVSYSIASLSGRHSEWFAVNRTTGIVTVATDNLDCETDSQPSFILIASDGGQPPLSSNVTVVVHIINVNDVAPTFVQSSFNVSVREDLPVGSCFLKLDAVDWDCGSSDTANLTYSFADDASVGSYELLLTPSGRLCLASSLDFERRQSFNFRVRVTDAGGLSSTASVAVQVTDVNDNVPVFYPLAYTVNVNDQLAVGSVVAYVNATDADKGTFGYVTYELLTSVSSPLFTLNTSTGAIQLAVSLAGLLPPQTFYVFVRARDGGGKVSSTNASITIIMLGPAAQPPRFMSSRYWFTVSESGTVVSFIGSVSAVAEVPGAAVTYSLASGDPFGWFQVNSSSGYLYTTLTKRDRELFSSVLLVVQASSGLPPVFAQTSVNISIDDVNDNAPVFASSTVYLSVGEDVANGSNLYTVQATDADSGLNGTVRYRIISNSDGVVAINALTGVMTLQRPLDHEQKKEYIVVVQAYDLGQPSSLTADQRIVLTVVDVNDNWPLFSHLIYSFVVNESASAGSLIGRVAATDRDSGVNGQVTYSWAVNSSLFGIDAASGSVHLKTKLDRELRAEYDLVARATDGGTPSQTASSVVIIKVLDTNDNAPSFLEKQYRFSVVENLVAGTVVGAVSATDPDHELNGAIVYTMLSSTSAFSVDARSGVISTSAVLDRELRSVYSLVVSATDFGMAPLTTTVTVTVDVLDVNDNAPSFPWLASAEAFVGENKSVGTRVNVFAASDNDVGVNGTITYTLLGGDKANFTVDSLSGWISTASVFDREVKDTYWVVLLAADGGEPSLNSSIMIIIRILDANEPPQFRTSTVSFVVTENIPIGTVVGNVTAHDYDVGNNAVVYYFVGARSTGNVFDVHAETGAIFSADCVDYEQSHSHWMLVTARDNGYLQQLSTTVNVSIVILDVNDNRPVFLRDPTPFYVAENAQPGYVVGVVNAADADSGANGAVMYSVTNSSTQLDDSWMYMTVDAKSGRVITIAPIDCEMTQVFFLVVQAEDQAVNVSQRLLATNTLVIIVVNENDNNPVFLTPSQVAVLEDEPIGFPVMSIVAVDGDRNDVVRYTILTGNEEEKFTLDSFSGILSLRSSLDRETIATYTLNVSATDNGYPPQSTTQALRIDVIDVNDNPPFFRFPTYTANITEGGAAKSSVTQLVATDADMGINAQLLYIIPNGTAHNMFTIDGHGTITTTAPLDREACSSYVFTAYVRDSAYPALYDQTTVLINVTDINDNWPVFASGEFRQHVPENMPGLTVVWHLVAYDADEGRNGQVFYNITGGNYGNVFSIEAATGIVRSQPLDRETVSNYYLEITASDLGVPALRNVTYLNVTVDDVNDNNPNFTQTGPYRISFSEDIARGTIVLNVSATDRDVGNNAKLMYFLEGLAGNESGSACLECDGKFAIGPDNGTMYTTGLFDREKKSFYTFYVKVADSAEYGPRYDQRVIEVTIFDVNDNVPVFTTMPIIANVSSVMTTTQQPILTVRAADKDAGQNGVVEYQLLNITGGGSFNIVRATGELFALASLSGLSSVQRIRVRASDRGVPPKYSDGIIELRIDNTFGSSQLRFPNTTYSVYLDENTPAGMLVITVRAVMSGTSTANVMYSLTGDATADTQPFVITPSTGEIRVADSSLLDYEVVPRFRVVVVAMTDQSSGGGVFSDYCTVWVNLRDLNDNAPVFTMDRYAAKVWEELPADTYVTKVTARDADDGANGQVEYAIQNPSIYPASMFNIISPSGIVSTTGPLDREQLEVIRVTIVASDNGEPKQYTTCTLRVNVVDVNDNAPVITNANQTVNVSEGLEVGKSVLTLFGQDADSGPRLAYGFVPGTPPGSPFNIDSMTGLITLARNLDRETHSSYLPMVYVYDTKYTTYANITVNVLDVNDNPPVFEKLSYEVPVLEDTPIGTRLVQVIARDADDGINGLITYSLQGTEGAVERFSVDPASGWITTRRVVTYSPQEPVAQLVVTAADSGEPSLSSVVFVRVTIMDINNYAPQFAMAQYIAHVSEDARPLTVIYRLQADDKDDSPENKKVDYTITGGNDAEMFELAMNTGVLSLVGALDRESVQQYQLVVMASDRGVPPRNSSVTMVINVDDANDNPPVFDRSEYVVIVQESIPQGSRILQVHATDRDSGGNGIVEYMIVSGNDDNLFNMNSATGEISLNPSKELDYEMRQEHRMSVRAMDNGLPRQSAVVAVIINVTDVNDNNPHFERMMYLETVKENHPAGSFVFRAVAKDRDLGIFGELTYGLSGANDHFQIDPVTGIVTTAVVFDYEAVTNYRFNVTVVDKGGSKNVVQVRVQILGQDEYKPVFESTKYMFSVNFAAEVGTVIGHVSATDADSGAEGKVVYTLKDPNWYFGVEADTGKVKVVNKLNEPPELSSASSSKTKRSYVSHRWQRSSDGAIVPKNDALVILATSGLPDSLVDNTIVQVQVDGYPDAADQMNTTPPGLTGTSLALVIGFAVIAIVLLIVIIILWMRGRRRKQRNTGGHALTGTISGVTDMSMVNDNVGGFLPSYGGDLRLGERLDHATTACSSPAHTDSSGRGSTGLREDDDEEIRAINSYPQPQVAQSTVARNKTMPDSGIQQDDDAASVQSAKDHHEYLARLGIDPTKIRSMPLDKKAENMRSVESMHHFSDEGGGEADSMDMGGGIYQKIAQGASGADLQGSSGLQHFSPSADAPAAQGGSLSSVTDSGEELTGSYNWDYLLDWGPQYQPLADVFSEIARLKDENVQPKRPAVKTVPVQNITSRLPTSSKMEPPPIITNIPPKTGPMGTSGRAESNQMSARTSQLTSMASLPRSPISHESSFSNLALSPTFTPVLSPLATTRSPSVSTIHTPGASERGTPRGLPARHRLTSLSQPAGTVSADSEFRI